MWPYYVMLLIIFLCIFREDAQSSEKGKKKIFLVALLPVFVLIAFKSSQMGNDTGSYLETYGIVSSERIFGTIDSDFGYDRIELGYKYFILFLSGIFPNPQVLSIATSLIVCIALYKFISRNATNRSLALFFFVTLGFFQFAMSGIRQTIAISIFLLGFKFVQEKKLFKFILIVLLAMSFHKSAIVFAPIYLVANMNVSRNKARLIYILLFVLYFLTDKLLLGAADVLQYEYGVESTGNGYIFFSIVVLITILATIHKDELVEQNPNNSVMVNISYISLATWVMRLVSRTMERVSLYFMPFTYVALEEFLVTRSGSNKTTYILIAVVLSSYLCIRRLSHDIDFCNYIFFFQ